jgi:phytoene synthase
MTTAIESAPSLLPTESQLQIAYAVCRGITRSQAKNFYYGFLVLPKRKRQALCAVYAFMRRCDDIADDPALPALERRGRLEQWLEAFHAAQAGRPTDDPILLALTDTQRRFHIPLGLLDALAYGTAMDLEASEQETSAAGTKIQYRTFRDLERYCYHVASVVGLVSIRIFGYSDPGAEALAERCGLAFQLTNIIRDVQEDARLGRIYLPEEDLERFRISAAELETGPDAARFRPLLQFEAQRAFEYYRAGDELLRLVAEDSQPALWVLVTIYRRLLEKIARSGYDVFARKMSLSLWEKLAILSKGFLKRIA